MAVLSSNYYLIHFFSFSSFCDLELHHSVICEQLLVELISEVSVFDLKPEFVFSCFLEGQFDFFAFGLPDFCVFRFWSGWVFSRICLTFLGYC